ncbi:MAG: hypothetical protein AAF518_11770 [Spirochaetota bacterium]
MSLHKERRKRFKRPTKLTLISCFLLAEPLLQTIAVSLYKNIPVSAIFQNRNPIWFLFWLLPAISGYGLLKVKKWGWYLFVSYSILLTGFNIYALTVQQTTYNYIAFAETILSFLVIFYIVREDISAPYFKMYPRGFRGEKRKPVQSKVEINGITKITRDRSKSGFYVDWQEPELELNQEVEIFFPDDKKPEKRKAGVVRIDKTGVGIAFRN